MELVNYFVLAVFAVLGLSLLSYAIGSIRAASAFWKITWLIVLMLLITAAVLLM